MASIPVQAVAEKPAWKVELDKIAQRYHTIGGWVAVVFNPLWSISDYYVIPEYWEIFLVIRLAVAAFTLGGILLQKPLKLPPEVLMFIPFLGIALQNAYMYSVMDVETLQKHTFAYIALWIGAGMLAMGRVLYTVIVVVTTLVVNTILFIVLSPLSAEEILVNGGLLTASVAIFTIVLVKTRYNLTVKEIKARLALDESKQAVERKNEVITEKNEEITSSILYAKRIQEAILPDVGKMEKLFKGLVVFYRPKDIVSGDFYWYYHKAGVTYIACVDCTGHGVPGAFMSMIGSSLLYQIVTEMKIETPNEILWQLRKLVIETLNRENEGKEQKDGMDISFCKIDHDKKMLEFAGAYNNLLMFRDGALQVFRADRSPIGVHIIEMNEPFTNHTIALQPGDRFYMYSDGYQDQFGGTRGKKFGSKQFREYLQTIHQRSFEEQGKALHENLETFKGDRSQMDDILVVGFQCL